MAEAKKSTKVTKEAKKDKVVKKVKKSLEATPKADFTALKFNGCLISKKRSGRFQVFAKNGKNVNGAEKTKILLDAKLIQASLPKASTEEAAAPAQE